MLTTNKMIGNITMNGIALHKNNLFNGLPVAQSLTGFLRGFFMELCQSEFISASLNLMFDILKQV
jgi:hypothetical protein